MTRWTWEHYCQDCRQWKATPDLPFHPRRVWTCEPCKSRRNQGGATPLQGAQNPPNIRIANQGVVKRVSSNGRPRKHPDDTTRKREWARRQKVT